MGKKRQSIFFLVLLTCSTCSLESLGLVKQSDENFQLGVGLILANYMLNLAEVQLSGIAVYFEDPANRAQTAKLAYQVRFRPGRAEVGSDVSEEGGVEPEFSFQSLSKKTVNLNSQPSSTGQFEVFVKQGIYTGTVYDSQKQSRGQFSFRIRRGEEGRFRIAERDFDDTVFIRMAAFRLGQGGATAEEIPADEGVFGDEPNPELFN